MNLFLNTHCKQVYVFLMSEKGEYLCGGSQLLIPGSRMLQAYFHLLVYMLLTVEGHGSFIK